YFQQPDSVDPSWRHYFDELARDGHVGSFPATPTFEPRSIFDRGDGRAAATAVPLKPSDPDSHRQHLVDELTREHRVLGHLMAQLDPLARPRPIFPELDHVRLGLTDADMDSRFMSYVGGATRLETLRWIIARL